MSTDTAETGAVKDNNSIHVNEISPGIKVYTEKNYLNDISGNKNWEVCYWVHSTNPTLCVNLNFDFTSSDNITLAREESNSSPSFSCEILPYTKHHVVKIRPLDLTIPSNIRLKYDISEESLSKNTIHELKLKDELQLSKSTEMMKKHYEQEDFESMHPLQLQQCSVVFQYPFIDKAFPPNTTSLGIVTNESSENLSWRFYKEAFPPPSSSSSFKQNKIEIGAFQSLSVYSTLQLISQHYSCHIKKDNACGTMMMVFNLRLCIAGEWKNIILDGFFPCFPGGGPRCAMTSDGAMWLPLMEKALAKQVGSYSALDRLQPAQVIEYVTGFPTRVLFSDTAAVDFNVVVNAIEKQRHLVFCTLTSGALIVITSVEPTTTMIHYEDYLGLFSTSTKSWEELSESVVSISECCIDSSSSAGYFENRMRFGWNVDGRASNQFLLSVSTAAIYYFKLYNSSCSHLSIVKAMEDGSNKFYLYSSSGTSNGDKNSDCCVLEVALLPGEYVIVPWNMQQGDHNGTTTSSSSSVADSFLKKLNGTMTDDVISREDLNNYLLLNEPTLAVNNSVTNEVYDWIINTFDATPKGLTRQGLCEVLNWLESKGGVVDISALMTSDSFVILAVHCKEEIKMSIVPYSNEIHN